MKDLKKVYKGKKVLITGHTGFKGAWLSIWLNKLGADVYGYALDPISKDGIFLATGIGEKITDLRGDIRDYAKLKSSINDIKPEIVFHLAAQPLVIESYQNPLETFDINTQGTANVLEALRTSDFIKAAVLITTDKCYENKERKLGYKEDEPMGGHDPYSASKGAAELIIASYRKSFFSGKNKTAIASARAGNVIGGGDWADNRLVPDLFNAIEKNKTIEIRNPIAVRPWQHVLEPLGGYLLLGARILKEPEKFAEAWNFGPHMHEVYTVKDVVEKIIFFAQKGEWKDTSDPNQLHEAQLLMLDISKAKEFLKWEPILNFDETIQYTTEWYINANHADPLKLTNTQIEKFEEKWNLRSPK